MKVKVYDQKAKEVGELTLDDGIFDTEVDDSILSQYVYVYLSNQRQGNAHTKDRSEVAGSGRKPWRQKGTGRARVGTKQNPIWRGGGVAFGPRNTVNWKKSLNKKFKKVAFRHSLSKVFDRDSVRVMESLSVDADKALTKAVSNILSNFDNQEQNHKYTLVTNELNEKLIKGANNLPGVSVVYVKDLNPYYVLNAGMLLIEKEAISYLQEKLS
ncbi:MAG: 50S ribosomal protein L4 [Candidatus Dojkabacteria bacterium]|nr:MAG: 50S ribosomal protein L4 [Candidatus Dojkabacteria bacterium]